MIQRRILTWIAPVGVGLLLVGAFLASRHSIVRHPTRPILQAGGAGFDAIRADEIQSILPEDAIPAIINPTYMKAADAHDFRGDELVLGVTINGDARAFPLSTLSSHEIVDDTIGGKPVAVTW